MATPTVFVSSTFYDLRYARESLKRFIEQFGYSPILSEDGAVFYDPKTTAAESCLREVSDATMLVLLIGGRYGMSMPSTDMSVTNAEYQRAIVDKVPVFALVEQATFNDYSVYQANKDKPAVLERISFPNSDSVKIFEFIDAVRSQAENNALVPFRTLSDIETYLRSQWAGMLHDHVANGTKSAQVVDTLEVLRRMNERVELIASQILTRVGGTPVDRVYITLMQALMSSEAVKDIGYFGTPPRPGDVLSHESVEECAAALGTTMQPNPDPEEDRTMNSISSGGVVSQRRRADMAEGYFQIRRELESILADSGIDASEIVDYEKQLPPRRSRRA